MRLFVALDIDDSILDRLDSYVRFLKPRVEGVRFVRLESYHVTLQFLGEAYSPDPIIAALQKIHHPEMLLTVAGTGFFPNARAPRVFWAGLEATGLPSLAKAVNRALAPLGFACEAEFHPHLTLARNGSGRPRPVRGEVSPAAFQRLVEITSSAAQPEFGTMTAHRFYLYESRLSPSGASYAKLAAFPLGQPALELL
jgi:2'-5' RNA ligase